MLQIKTYPFSYLLIAVTIVNVLFLGEQATAQENITLQQAVELTLKNNLQIKQAALSEALSEANLKEAKLSRLPTLNAGSNLNFNFGRNVDPFSYTFVNQEITSSNGSINTSLPIFQGFQRVNQISQIKYELEADKSNTRKVQNDLALLVVTNYLQILNYRDILAAARQQLDLSALQLDIEQKQLNVGNRTVADLSQAKAQVATAELNVTNAKNQLDLAYLSLAQLMERNPADTFKVVQPAVDELTQTSMAYSAAEVFTKAVDNYPDIKLAQYRTLAALKAVDVAKGGLYPRLSFQGSMGSGYSSLTQRIRSRSVNGNSEIGFVEGTNQRVLVPNVTTSYEQTPFRDQINQNFNQVIGFSLTIPVFNGYSSRMSLKRAKISYQNAQLNEQISRNNFNKTIYQAVTDLRAAETRFNSAQTAYQSSLDAFNAIQQRYNIGLANSLDFNQSQTNLNKSQFDVIQARYDLIFRSKVIDFYLGNPITF